MENLEFLKSFGLESQDTHENKSSEKNESQIVKKLKNRPKFLIHLPFSLVAKNEYLIEYFDIPLKYENILSIETQIKTVQKTNFVSFQYEKYCNNDSFVENAQPQTGRQKRKSLPNKLKSEISISRRLRMLKCELTPVELSTPVQKLTFDNILKYKISKETREFIEKFKKSKSDSTVLNNQVEKKDVEIIVISDDDDDDDDGTKKPITQNRPERVKFTTQPASTITTNKSLIKCSEKQTKDKNTLSIDDLSLTDLELTDEYDDFELFSNGFSESFQNELSVQNKKLKPITPKSQICSVQTKGHIKRKSSKRLATKNSKVKHPTISLKRLNNARFISQFFAMK